VISYSRLQPCAVQAIRLTGGYRYESLPPFADYIGAAIAVFGRDGTLLAINRAFAALHSSLAGSRQKTFLSKEIAALSSVESILHGEKIGKHSYVFILRRCQKFEDGISDEAYAVATALRIDQSTVLPTQYLVSLIGLTKREAELATAIAQGIGVYELAESSGVSQGTIRIQLKSIFRKAGVRGQTELCALLRPGLMLGAIGV
jgi:DNA-binding CsgD family transcriptional regulator